MEVYRDGNGEIMKTLYVSDLDGTLLRTDESVSGYTCDVINRLMDEGMCFSFATARSVVTTKKATKGLNVVTPLVLHNGVFVTDAASGKRVIENIFDNSIDELLDDLFASNITPIVYSFINDEERFSLIPGKMSEGANTFLETRRGDKRWREARSNDELTAGKIFYITCIDEKEKLEPLYEKYKDTFHAVYGKDFYTGNRWLEFMSKKATKANAILQLKDYLGCDKIISFGDAHNDIDMFEISDEAYAVANAIDELKAIATGVIGSNDDDGVAKWLKAHYC